MAAQEELETLLACPVCGNSLDPHLKCTFCNRKYESREGVRILIDRGTSGIEWKWDRRILSQKYRKEVMGGYSRLMSPEVRKAHEMWWRYSMPHIKKVSGLAVDLATGLGMMLEQVLGNSNAEVIATDIDPNVLLSTKRELDQKLERKAFYIATDVKHMALRSESVDYVTSLAGVNNIISPSNVMEEIHRILKPGGKALLMSSFLDEDTPSADLAEDYGFLEAYIQDAFLDLCDSTGFRVLENREASRVVWKENEMDIFPIEGDMVYYHVLRLERA